MAIIELVKGWTGGFREAKEGEESTLICMDKEDYLALIDERDSLNRRITQLNSKFVNEKAAIIREQAVKVTQLQDATDLKIKSLEQDLAEAQRTVVLLERKNENLVRITKERANADRGIQPKKQRSGYLLQTMEQTRSKALFLGSKQERVIKPCWKVRFQTPYNTGFRFDVAKESIERDFIDERFAEWGIDTVYGRIELFSKSEINDIWKQRENFAFDFSYKLNAVRGYWEVEFYIRYSLQIVSDILPE